MFIVVVVANGAEMILNTDHIVSAMEVEGIPDPDGNPWSSCVQARVGPPKFPRKWTHLEMAKGDDLEVNSPSFAALRKVLPIVVVDEE